MGTPGKLSYIHARFFSQISHENTCSKVKAGMTFANALKTTIGDSVPEHAVPIRKGRPSAVTRATALSSCARWSGSMLSR